MAFTIQDFHDLVELLAQHPEWRAELRRHVLSDELLELPALVRQLAESQARTESRLDRVDATLERLAEAQARTEGRLDRVEAVLQQLAEAQARTEGRLDQVEGRLDRVEGRLDGLEAALQRLAAAQVQTEEALRDLVARHGRVEDRLGDLDGQVLELVFARKAAAFLGRFVRRLRVVESYRLSDLLDDAIDDGRINPEDRAAILNADVVLSARREDDGQDVYLVVEVSSGVRTRDVERAVTRAKLLEKLGRPVLPIVAGRRIQRSAADLARSLGATFVVAARDSETWDAEADDDEPPDA